MASQLKSDTARTNGAKSRGPVSPEGRAKSSVNRLHHGLRAESIVLPTESIEEYQRLLDDYRDQFQPQTQVENELVESMAVSRWRLRRIVIIEANLLNTEMGRRAGDIDNEFETDNDGRLAWVFQKLADHGKSLGLLLRYEGALNRSYDRAFKQLQLLQSTRRPPQPNEPKPRRSPARVTTDPPATSAGRAPSADSYAVQHTGDTLDFNSRHFYNLGG